MTGARTKRAQRIAAILPLVSRLRKLESAYDTDWQTRHDSHEDRGRWLATPISHGNRSASALDDSNYAVAMARIEAASGFSEAWKWPDWTAADGTVIPGSYQRSGGTDERSDAWVGGLILTLLVRADDAGAIIELGKIIDSLESYPILDGEHLSEMEYERNHPSDHECYADEDSECSCDVAVHLRNPDHSGLAADDDGEAWCDLCHEYVDVDSPIE